MLRPQGPFNVGLELTNFAGKDFAKVLAPSYVSLTIEKLQSSEI